MLLSFFRASILILCMNPSLLAAEDRLAHGRTVYEQQCARCHDSGLNGAPVTGQREQWSERSRNWEAVLFEHAEQGYMDMPAKGGGAALTRYDIDAAGEYMLGLAFPELPHD